MRAFDQNNSRQESGCITEAEYAALNRKNQRKRFSRKLIPAALYEALRNWKRRYSHKTWDTIA